MSTNPTTTSILRMPKHDKQKLPPPSGHELPLASMVKNRERVRIVTLRGEVIIGDLMNFDKFSVTIGSFTSSENPGVTEIGPEVFFKHALERFGKHGARV